MQFVRLLPKPLKIALGPIYRKAKRYRFFLKYRFWPPPDGTDITGYEILLDFIVNRKIFNLDGDFLEIGAFLGGGSYKLSKLLERIAPWKSLYVVDIFDPDFDATQCTTGVEMRQLYKRVLERVGNNDQESVFKLVTKTCNNIVVIKGDSKNIQLPATRLCFAFIDGNHDPVYVENDFYLAWNRLVRGGYVAFDDYGFDLPQVTQTVDRIMQKHHSEISEVVRLGKKIIVLKRGEA